MSAQTALGPIRRTNPLFIVAIAVLLAVWPAFGRESPPPDPSPLVHIPDADRKQEAVHLRHIRRITWAGSKNGEAYFSPDGKRICFQGVREAGLKNPFYQIYVMDRATGDAHRVSAGMGGTTCSYFHPKKERLLFATSHLDPKAKDRQAEELAKLASGRAQKYEWFFDPGMDIFETDLDGGNPVRLTETPGYDAECGYSPDGTKIVFCSFRDGDGEIYTMNADGSGAKRLTEVKGYDGGPFFSPDGAKIVWRRFSPDDKVAEVWTMNADGSAPTQVTKLGAVAWAPYFTPDGKWIIFASNHEDPAFEIYAVRPDGSELTRLTYAQGFDGLPVPSPDGKRLMWTSTRDGDKSHLYIGELVLPGEARATPPPEHESPPIQMKAVEAMLEKAQAAPDGATAALKALGFEMLSVEGAAVAGALLPQGVAAKDVASAESPVRFILVGAVLDGEASAPTHAAFASMAQQMQAVASFRGTKLGLVFVAWDKKRPSHTDLWPDAWAKALPQEKIIAAVHLADMGRAGQHTVLHARRGAEGWRLLTERLAAAHPHERLYLIDERFDADLVCAPDADAVHDPDGVHFLKLCAKARVPGLVVTGRTGAKPAGDKPEVSALRDRAAVALGAVYRLATNSAAVEYTLKDELAATNPKRVYLGTRPEYTGDGSGVILKSVYHQSPAEKAGLRGGDKIVKLNGQPTPDAEAMLCVLEGLVIGQAVPVDIERDGKAQTLTITPSGR